MSRDQYDELEVLRREAFANDNRPHDAALISLCERLYAERDWDEAMNINNEWEN